MSDSPYSEGWPRRLVAQGEITIGGPVVMEEVVPLSDAERMREALEDIRRCAIEEENADFVRGFANGRALAALRPELFSHATPTPGRDK